MSFRYRRGVSCRASPARQSIRRFPKSICPISVFGRVQTPLIAIQLSRLLGHLLSPARRAWPDGVCKLASDTNTVISGSLPLPLPDLLTSLRLFRSCCPSPISGIISRKAIGFVSLMPAPSIAPSYANLRPSPTTTSPSPSTRPATPISYRLPFTIWTCATIIHPRWTN